MSPLVLLFALVACDGPTIEDSGDTAGPPTADLLGAVVDPVAGGAAVPGASVLVSTPDGFLTGSSGEDGSFTVSEVLSEEPLWVTVWAAGRTARTYQLERLDEAPQPLVFSLPRQRISDYEGTSVQITGTVSGQPAGSRVCFYWSGPTGEYCMDSPGNDELHISFSATFLQADPPYGLSVLALDASDGSPHTGTVVSTPGGSITVDLLEDPTRVLVVRTDQPEVGNKPLTSHDPYHEDVAGRTHLGELRAVGGTATWTGVTTEVIELADGLELTLPYVPSPGKQNRVELYLSRTVGTGHYAWADVPLVVGNPFEVDLLDGPEVDKVDFAPGTVLEWDAIPEAEDFMLQVVSEDDAPLWELHSQQPTLGFPTFPDDFDGSQLFGGGESWNLRSRARDDGDWDWVTGEVDPMGSYRATVTQGGKAEWE